MDAFKAFAMDNNWGLILPEISLGILALVLLMGDVFFKSPLKEKLPALAIWGQVAILGSVFYSGLSSEKMFSFSQLVFHSPLGDIMRIFFLLSSIMVTYIAGIYLKKHSLPKVEFYAVSLIATASLMLLSQAHHFVLVFVTLETFAVSSFVLVSYSRTSSYSLEAGLKILIMGALSSSLLLFGIVLLYGISGNPEFTNATSDGLNFTQLGKFIEANSDNIIVQIGAILVFSGIAFKIGAVPFQIWIPDVYQGAPTPTMALLAVSSKAAGFVLLLNLIQGPFQALEYLLFPIISAVAAASILFGNIGALSQKNVKKIMGLSGVSHAGYILIGVLASYKVSWAFPAVVFYLFTYLLASFAVFSVMSQVAGKDDENQYLDDYKEFAANNPFLGGVLTIGLGSLAGIPPLVGFIGKLLLFIAAFEAKMYFLLAIAVVGVVISIFYYFGWMREVYFVGFKSHQDKDMPSVGIKLKLSLLHYAIMGALVVLTVVLGFNQSLLSKLVF